MINNYSINNYRTIVLSTLFGWHNFQIYDYFIATLSVPLHHSMNHRWGEFFSFIYNIYVNFNNFPDILSRPFFNILINIS